MRAGSEARLPSGHGARHAADPWQWRGTTEFQPLSSTGLLHRALATARGTPASGDERGLLCPLCILPLSRESCYRDRDHGWQVVPSTVTGQHTQHACTQQVTLVAPRSEDTGLETMENGSPPAYVAPECAPEIHLPPSCPCSIITIPCGSPWGLLSWPHPAVG